MRCTILVLVFLSTHTVTQENTRVAQLPILAKQHITTDRCYLRPTRAKEYKQFSKAMSFDDVLCYYLFHGRVSATSAQRNFGKWFNKKSIQLFLSLHDHSKNPRIWTIVEKETNTVLGFIGLHRLYNNVNTALSIYNKKNYNLSLSILPEYQGNQLSFEVTSAFAHAFFNTKKYKKSSGLTFLVNVRNERALSCITQNESSCSAYCVQEQGIFTYKYSKKFTMACYTLSRTRLKEYLQTLKDVNVIV